MLEEYFLSLEQNKGKTWEQVEPVLSANWGGMTKRLGLPSDVAALVAFLVSDLAENITGANMRVDGGMTGFVN